jgi:hypothetical protein
MSQEQLCITQIPILGLVPCSVPVLPGTSRFDAPLEERTELCAVDSHWLVGRAPTCDTHLAAICAMLEWDWAELIAEAGRDLEDANRPWDERERHSQKAAHECRDHFEREH